MGNRAGMADSKKNNNHLSRQLTLVPLFSIIVANMIGSGIFTTSGFIIRDVGNPWAMLLCWLLGGLMALMGALCYGELGAMFPMAGGDYIFLRESFGKGVAFLSGWISLWVGFSAPIAAVAIAFGKYSNDVLPVALQRESLPVVLALLVILLFSMVHLRGLGFGTGMQNALTFGKILLILVLIVGGFVWGKGSWGHLSAVPRLSHIFSADFATSLIFVSFAYSGWNACVYIGSEVKDPGRNIPASILVGTLFVIVLYLLLNLVYVYAVSPGEMSGVVEVGSLAAGRLFGEKAGHLFGLVIAFGLLSTVSSMIMIGPRVYYAMARDHLFFDRIRSVDHRHQVPSYAILLQAGIAMTLVLTSTFYAILMYVGFVLALFSSLTVLGVMVLRHREPQAERPYKTWGYPFTPLLFVAGNIWIVVFSIRSHSTAFLWGLVTMVSGWIVYEYFDRRSRKLLSMEGVAASRGETESRADSGSGEMSRIADRQRRNADGCHEG